MCRHSLQHAACLQESAPIRVVVQQPPAVQNDFSQQAVCCTPITLHLRNSLETATSLCVEAGTERDAADEGKLDHLVLQQHDSCFVWNLHESRMLPGQGIDHCSEQADDGELGGLPASTREGLCIHGPA